MNHARVARPDAARAWPARSALLLLAILCGCAYALVRGNSVNPDEARKIEQGIQDLRELSFKSSVPVIVMSPDQAEQAILEEIAREYTDAQLKTEGEAGAMVGLYPRGIDLKAESLKLLKSQIAGFYDSHRKEMILVSGNIDIGFRDRLAEFIIQRDLAGEMLLAHELTHALQDQHFAVDQQLEKLDDNDDRQLALKSVAEGDATLAGLGYAAGQMNDETVKILVARLDQLPAQFAALTAGVPEALSEPLIFQYSAGAHFVGEAFHRGGWKAVDELYRSPPQSSQQIMHPAFYFDHPVLPANITIRGYQQVIPGWQKDYENCMGALMLQVILKRNLGPDAPEVQLADRWAGDRMVVLRKGNKLTILWVVFFRDDRSAQRFAAAYGTALDRILGAGTAHHLETRPSTVMVVIGDGANQYAALGAQVWKTIEIKLPPISAPPALRAAGNSSSSDSSGAALATGSGLIPGS
ncbi:MAG: hypothetical protein ACHQZS_07375 [Candidatus Binatales bacterium]